MLKKNKRDPFDWGVSQSQIPEGEISDIDKVSMAQIHFERQSLSRKKRREGILKWVLFIGIVGFFTIVIYILTN